MFFLEVFQYQLLAQELLICFFFFTGNNLQVHAYERSNRVYNYTLDPCGPVHIMVGDGGNREKMAIEHADAPGKCPEPSTTPDTFIGGFCATNFTFGPAAGKFCWDRQPDFSAFRESSFGHGILEVLSLSLSLSHTHTHTHKLLVHQNHF